MTDFIKRYPIGSFLAINYFISWTFLYPCYQVILDSEEIPPIAFIGIIGAYGPMLAAIIVQYTIDKVKLKELIKTIAKIKVGFYILAFVMVVPILIYIISYLISAEIFGGSNEVFLIEGLKSIPLYMLFALPFGPMGEELGWRGFMLPRLLNEYSVMKATILVGLAWGVWHAASFTFPGAAIPSFLPVNIWTIGLYFINTISLSMIFTYAHFTSKGSVFIAIILHAFFNAASNITFSFFIETEDFNLLLASYITNIILVGVVGWFLIRRAK